jgi:hypothetical protein
MLIVVMLNVTVSVRIHWQIFQFALDPTNAVREIFVALSNLKNRTLKVHLHYSDNGSRLFWGAQKPSLKQFSPLCKPTEEMFKGSFTRKSDFALN